MPGYAEIYFIAAMMVLIIVISFAAVYFFFRQYKKEMREKADRLERKPGTSEAQKATAGKTAE